MSQEGISIPLNIPEPMDIKQFQQNMASGILRAVAMFGPIVAITATYDAYINQTLWTIPFYWVSYGVVLLLLFWKGVPYTLQVGSIIGLLYILGCIDFIQDGLGGSARVFMLTIPFMAGIFLGRWEAVLATLLSSVTMGGFGAAFSAGLLVVPGDAKGADLGNWIPGVLTLFLLGMMVAVSLNRIIPHLRNTIQQSQKLTQELEDLVVALDKQIDAHTLDLEIRSAYLQASIDVSQATNTILDPDQLIQQVVELIRGRLGLYYVGLFQVDETGDWAVLRAGTGTAGEAMLSRGHRIRIGTGMIGWCIANARPRVAMDVDKDEVRLVTPELPETRSEAALPLRSRGQVIGALTIQSVLPNAFDEDVLTVLQVMVDQVAVALDNARLYVKTQETLESIQRLYGEQTLEVWRELLRARPDIGYLSDELGVSSARDVWRTEMEQAMHKREAVQFESQDGKQALAIPIKIRDTVVGVLDTYKPGGVGGWTDEEIRLLEDITDQLGVALESAQFFGETRQRAETERLVGEVVSRMRQTLDIDDVMQTTASELRRLMDLAEVEIRLDSPIEQPELVISSVEED